MNKEKAEAIARAVYGDNLGDLDREIIYTLVRDIIASDLGLSVEVADLVIENVLSVHCESI